MVEHPSPGGGWTGDSPMRTDLDKLAVEAEADRLSGVYMRIMILARAQRIDLLQAGREAVAKGLVRAADWGMLREAMGGR